LYEVASEDIHSETPVFQCISCDNRFGFEYPPVDAANVLTFAVSTPGGLDNSNAQQNQELSAEELLASFKEETVVEPTVNQVQSQEMKSCPKCGALNGRRSKECYSCHVLFERLEGLPSDPSLRAQPSLVRKWKNVLENFEDVNLHEAFVKSCGELDAFKFAIMKYEEIKSAQGGDALCDQMIARINSMMMVGMAQKSTLKTGAAVNSNRPKWMKWVYIGPFALSGILILWGMLNLGHRNLIGVGVALSCMAVGLIVMIRGRLSLSDFME
jgi:ribosomal protein L40E